jgi:hypothetical protein
MTRKNVDRSEFEFAAAWRAFKDQDMNLTAPPAVQYALMEAWREHQQRRDIHPALGHRPYRQTAFAAAAVLVIAGTAVVYLVRAPRGSDPARSLRPAMPQGAAGFHGRPVDDATGAGSHAQNTDMKPGASAPSGAGHPALEDEPLQLVRLRMPREALQAFGVALVEPDVVSVVDVDLLVADDGSPRSIRSITAVIDRPRQE